MTDVPPFLTHPEFSFPGMRYGFFTRAGGVSTGPFASLNCGENSQDSPRNIDENFRRIAQAMGVAETHLVSCGQIHSTTVVTATEPWPRTQRPKADAMVTKQRGLALGIKSADCGPVLFYDDTAGVIGAAHAGWKGALGNIMGETVQAMEKLGAKAANISAVLGPCIQQNSYEVGQEFPAPFLKQSPDNERFFKKAPRESAPAVAGNAEQGAQNQKEHFLFDLPGFIQQRLREAGLKSVQSLGFDTCSDEARFFSYRRATLRKEGDNGTLLSAIVLS